MSLQMLLDDDYKVHLEVFEGPLDLLLYLIRREELDIYDIPIERITAQYMNYLDVMRMLDFNIAGDFLVMATTLMMIKSRMLLPVEERPTDIDSDEEWIDPRLDLVRQLVEYKKFKDVATRLQEMEAVRAETFMFGGEHTLPTVSEPDTSHVLADITIFDLLGAFQEILERMPLHPLEQIEPIRWSITDKMEMIIERTSKGEELLFSQLFSATSPRMEVIITFLALLELLRLRQIRLLQHTAFHDIQIQPAANCNSAQNALTNKGEEHVTI